MIFCVINSKLTEATKNNNIRKMACSKMDVDKQCCICLDDEDVDRDNTIPCRHTVCRTCYVKPMLDQCPVCREPWEARKNDESAEEYTGRHYFHTYRNGGYRGVPRFESTWGLSIDEERWQNYVQHIRPLYQGFLDERIIFENPIPVNTEYPLWEDIPHTRYLWTILKSVIINAKKIVKDVTNVPPFSPEVLEQFDDFFHEEPSRDKCTFPLRSQ